MTRSKVMIGIESIGGRRAGMRMEKLRDIDVGKWLLMMMIMTIREEMGGMIGIESMGGRMAGMNTR